MSRLDSLRVLGIRSFGPDEGDVGGIKFLSPITLILGQNGCGKTTLIECLKFATCGDVPDNTNRGKDFVNDPQLNDPSNFATKAYVKLKFNDINGDTFLISRPIQVTRKQKNLEFKRLESAIRIVKPNGQSSDLSSRCTDIDDLITSSLGVSKAILTNVIFCHQEDSCWPLEEGKKVKDKFDTIFDAKKYNTCLENIKKIRKERQTELKIMKNDLQYLSERRSEASNKRAQLSDTESRMDAQCMLVRSMKEKLLPVTDRLQEIAEKEDSIGKLRTEFGTFETRLSSLQEMIKDLKSRINSVFTGSDEELKNAFNNIQEEFSMKQLKLKNLDEHLEQIEYDYKLNKAQEKKEEVNLNKLMRDSDRLNEKIEYRNKILLDLCQELDIDNVSRNLLSDGRLDIGHSILLVENAITEKQDDVTDMKSEHEAIIQELQTEIDTLREEKAKTESLIDHKKQIIIKVHKECDKLRQDVDEVDKSAESLCHLETKLVEVNKKLNELDCSFDATKLDQKIQDKKQERVDMEKELVLIESEVQSIQKLSGLKAEIDIQKDLKKSKQEDIKKIIRRHGESLKQLIGEIPEQGAKIKFQAALSKLGDEIRTKTEEIKISERDVTRLESDKRYLLDQLREAKQSLTTDECLVDQECGKKDYDTYLSELSAKVQAIQDQKGTISSSEYMFQKYIEQLKVQDPCCPLCERDFPNEEDVNSLIMDLSFKMRELPSKLKKSNEQLEESQEKYKALLQLKPKFEKLSKTKNITIPGFQADLEKTEQKLDNAQKALNNLQKDLAEPLSKEELAKNIQSDVVLLDQLWSDSKKIDKEIQKLELKLPPGSQRCLEDVIGEQELLRSKLSRSRELEEKLQTTLNSSSFKKQKLQEEKSYLQSQQIKISGNAQMRSQLVEKLRENENVLASTQMEIDQNSESLEITSVKLEKCLSQIKTQMANNTKTLQENISRFNLVKQKFNDLKPVQKDIEELELSSVKEKLKVCKNIILDLQKTNERNNQKKEELLAEREELKTVVSSQKTHERNLEDNVKLRKKLTEEADLTEKVKVLKLRIGSTDYVSIMMEKNKLRQEEEKINRERALAEGRQRELKNTHSSIKAELDKDIYKNADKNYRDKFINIKVEELSIEDLNKYYIALDWALTQFHQDKMKAINSTIRDLWRQIYKGNDIDAIEIKADIDSSLSADKRRTYNYRVVQKKNNVEMDMRGRCSAGQKVLACLIIRMALAETFSANCGVLALDEPTTNLDEENIHSLSEALVQIVNQRSRRKNFQLIIISHDKTFLEVLQRIDKAEYYYKIRRDESGKSRIEKHNVHGMDMAE